MNATNYFKIEVCMYLLQKKNYIGFPLQTKNGNPMT